MFISVNFHRYDTQETISVRGYFPLIAPWWAATFCAVKRRYLFHMKGYPSYQLRRDSLVGPQGIIYLFLKACGLDQEHCYAFSQTMKWVS